MKRLFFLLLICPVVVLAQPANDNPCGAITLVANQPFCDYYAFFMGGATFNPANPLTSCFPQSGNTTPKDLWFKFVMPASGSVTIRTEGSFTVDDAVMEVSTGATCSALTYITCNDDGNVSPYLLMPVLTVNRPAGEIIYLRLYQYNLLTNEEYQICIVRNNEPLALTKVGIGTVEPDSTLDVNGNLLVRGGMRIAGGLKLNAGTPGAGKVLTSDASGNSTWQPVPTELPLGTVNQTLRHNGTTFVASSALQNDGTNTTVAGQLRIQGGSPGVGKVLTSDGSGLGSWSSLSAFNIGFRVENYTSQTFTSVASNVKVGFPNVASPYFSNTDSTFTVPGTGLYRFKVKMTIAPVTSTIGTLAIYLVNQSGITYNAHYIPASGRSQSVETDFTINLVVGQKWHVAVLNTTGAAVSTLSGGGLELTYFEAYLLK